MFGGKDESVDSTAWSSSAPLLLFSVDELKRLRTAIISVR